jgi:hypothetical protein
MDALHATPIAQPRQIMIVAELPKPGPGKIMRRLDGWLPFATADPRPASIGLECRV